MDIAISPCPNDTFLFHGWISGNVGKELLPSVHFADIEQLNEWAVSRRFPLIKVSIACFKEIQDHYELLPVGCALGYHAGPKLIAKAPLTLRELENKIIAIPGRLTTANLLFDRLIRSHKRKHFCRYHEVFSLLKENKADVGLIIHESRFSFAQEGFYEIADLGDLWHKKTSLPLPLGGLAIKKEIPQGQKNWVVSTLQDSLSFARKFPKISEAFIVKMAQEKELSIVKQHIETYVNAETEKLSEEGQLAIATLLNQVNLCLKN